VPHKICLLIIVKMIDLDDDDDDDDDDILEVESEVLD
jgi:hypothetical protein